MPVAEGARRVRGVGPIPAQVAIYGEAPGKSENYRGEPFIGKAGAVLSTFLSWHGLKRSACFISNVCQFWPGRGRDGRDLKPDAADLARDEPVVMRELRMVQPKVVLALGGFATSWFLPRTSAEQDLVTINGIPHLCEKPGLESLIVIPIIHPAAGLHNPKDSAWTWLGIREAARFLKGGPGAPQVWREKEPDTRVVLSKPKRVQELTNKAAVDTEGNLAEPWCLSYDYGSGQTVVVLAADCDKVVFGGEVIMHNAAHDIPILKRLGVGLPRWSCIEDTMLAGAATAEHPYNLKALSYRLLNVRQNHYDRLVAPYLREAASSYLLEIAAREWDPPKPFLKYDQKSRSWKECNPQPLHKRAWAALKRLDKGVGDPVKWLGDLEGEERSRVKELLGTIPSLSTAIQYAPLEEAVQYAGLDAWATFKIHPLLMSFLEDTKRVRAYRHDQYLTDALVEMHSTGLPFDVDRCSAIDKEFAIEEKRSEALVKKLAKSPHLNVRSSQQVSAVLNTLGATGRKLTLTGNESTDEKELKRLQESPRSSDSLRTFVDALLDNRGWGKLRSTYTKGLPKHIHNGRIYPHLSVTTAVTGRFASEDPNLQNIPARNAAGMKIRSCFRAPKGWTLLSCDLSQIELRIAAHLGNDPVMVKAFKTGEDLHEKTRLQLFRDSPDLHTKDPVKQDFMRKPAKIVNFSALNLISEQGLHTQFLMAGVKSFSVEDAGKFLKGFWSLYAGLDTAVKDTEQFIRQHGYAQTEEGKVRYLPLARLIDYPSIAAEALRHAWSQRVQGGAGAYLKRGVHRWSSSFREACNRIAPTLLLLQIHDELLAMVKVPSKDDPLFLKIAALFKRMLEEDPGSSYRVPIKAEVKGGPSWGEMEKVKV